MGPNKCNANGRLSYRQALAMISISYPSPSPCPCIKILHLYVIFYIFTGPNLFIQDIRYNLVPITTKKKKKKWWKIMFDNDIQDKIIVFIFCLVKMDNTK